MSEPTFGNQPVTPEAEKTPLQAVQETISGLAKSRAVTRDQERVANEVLADQKYALLANRTLNQGADPAWLQMVAPEAVAVIATSFGLSSEQVNNAIELAHKAGPAAFAIDSPEEMLWLLLAKYSIDEADKLEGPHKVVAASARKMVELEQYASGQHDFLADAQAYRTKILSEVISHEIASLGSGVPLYTSDLGFYAAYRTGNHVAAVRATDGLVFYGTDGSVTLEEAGITVDKPLSKTFGIVFPKA